MVLTSYVLMKFLHTTRKDIAGFDEATKKSKDPDTNSTKSPDKKDNTDNKKDTPLTKIELNEKTKILKTISPDEYLDRDSRQHGGATVLSDTTFLKTMTPSFLTDHLVESKHDYRWIPDKWPKCKETCSQQALNREVKCWGRNTTPYSDDISLDKLFTIPANQKDEFGDTPCDRAKSGLTVNVKPNESSFCSLINDCSRKTIHPLANLPVPLKEEIKKYDHQYIGFLVQDLNSLPPEQRKVLEAAFGETHVEKVISGQHGTLPQTEKSLSTTVEKLKLHISTLTDTDKKNLVSGLHAIKLKSQSEKTYDIGSLIFSSLGISI